MSFNRLPALESQPPEYRDEPETQDDAEFDKFGEEISTKLFSLTANIARLSQQVSLLGTKRDTERVRERVRDLLDESREGFQEVGDGIKRIAAWEDLNASQKYTQQKLSREFHSSGTEFQTIQRLALEKQRASASAARTALETSNDSSAAPYSDNPPAQQQSQQQEQSQLRLASQEEVDFQESLIVERETEIRNIEQSVGELNELFRDVAHIVHEQGGQLDTIHGNVVSVAGDTRQADIELRSASKYQKSARGRAFCLLLVLVVVLTIIIVAAAMG